MPDSARGRLISAVVMDDGVRITVNRGTVHGLFEGWVGVLLDGEQEMDGGHFVITAAREREADATVQLAIGRVAECSGVSLGAR